MNKSTNGESYSEGSFTLKEGFKTYRYSLLAIMGVRFLIVSWLWLSTLNFALVNSNPNSLWPRVFLISIPFYLYMFLETGDYRSKLKLVRSALEAEEGEIEKRLSS